MVFEKIDRTVRKTEKALTDISWIVCLFVTLLVVTDIFLRFFLNRPLPATWEMSEICMPWIVFFPFAYASTTDVHVRVSLIKDRMSPKVRSGFEITGDALSFLICAMLTYWSWLRFWESFMIREEILAAVKLPWWVGKFAMPIGLGMFSLRYLLRMFLHAAGTKDTEGGL
jgi:TRAP-type C4-dicarboxylate transport system permease small subunit